MSSELKYSLSIARIAIALTRERGSRHHFSVIFTSLNPAEGVTHLVTDLARYLSANGKGKVIVVDLSGMGSLAKLLGANEDHFVGKFSNLHTTGLPNLFFLAPGFLPERAGGEAMRGLLGTLSLEGGTVIIDAPRVLEDGLLTFAGFADGIILVLDPELTNRNQAVDAVREMKGKGAKVMGVVLNRSEKK